MPTKNAEEESLQVEEIAAGIIFCPQRQLRTPSQILELLGNAALAADIGGSCYPGPRREVLPCASSADHWEEVGTEKGPTENQRPDCAGLWRPHNGNVADAKPGAGAV